MEIMIINQQNIVNYNKEMQHLITNVVNNTAKLGRLPKNTEVSILIVDNSYIQELNFIYRSQNKPTDVLSFSMNETNDNEPNYDEVGEVNLLGDIIISLEQAQVQSKEYGHSLERELGFLVAHGMLHLLGYDHETEEERMVMHSLEEKVMQVTKLER